MLTSEIGEKSHLSSKWPWVILRAFDSGKSTIVSEIRESKIPRGKHEGANDRSTFWRQAEETKGWGENSGRVEKQEMIGICDASIEQIQFK